MTGAAAGPHEGAFFDGVTARRHDVRVQVSDGLVAVRGSGILRDEPAAGVRLAEPTRRGPVIIRFGDGASCEVRPARGLYGELLRVGAQAAGEARFFHALKSSRRVVASALLFLAAMLAAIYIWLIPAAAELAAPLIPLRYKVLLGDNVLEALDRSKFAPSRLSDRQAADLRKALDTLKQATGFDATLKLRSHKEGPNAFALPGGVLVITDELVELMEADLDGMRGVMAHELGHIKHDHGLRSVIQVGLLGLAAALVTGDYSSFLAAAQVTLGALQYSRGFEAEADQFAFLLLCAHGIDPGATARFFDKMNQKYGAAERALPSYFLSHGSSARRAEYFRAPCP